MYVRTDQYLLCSLSWYFEQYITFSFYAKTDYVINTLRDRHLLDYYLKLILKFTKGTHPR